MPISSMRLFQEVAPVVTPNVDWAGLLPAIIPAASAIVLVLVRSLAGAKSTIRRRGFWTMFDSVWVLITALVGFVAVVSQWNRLDDFVDPDGFSDIVIAPHAIAAFGDHLISDRFSLLVSGVIFAVLAAVSLVSPSWCQKNQKTASTELYVLMLLAVSGAVVMAGANDLLVLFLGLETMSIALYVLAAINRRMTSLESGIKYFVLGAFSSAFLLYGIALLYGATGTTSLTSMDAYLRSNLLLSDVMLMLGIAMVLVGLGFKVAAVPFHAWVPDVYQGAPTPVTSFMASAVKAAAFAGLVRVLMVGLRVQIDDWRIVVFALASATLVLGAILSIVQGDLKRLLAYSSVSHAGFILVGVQAASEDGVAAVLFYLVAYAVMVVGSFTVLGILAGSSTVDSIKGLSSRQPLLAAAFAVLMLAQAGVPFTSGFVAKFSAIAAAAGSRSWWLAVVAMVSAVIGAFAYLRAVVAMYFSDDDTGDDSSDDDSGEPDSSSKLPKGPAVVIAACVVVTIVVGIFPGPLDDLAREAASTLLSN